MGENLVARKLSDRPGVDPSQVPPSSHGVTKYISQPLSLRGRLARALASPLGVLVIFPSLVLAVGVFLTWMAQDALRGSNLELARTRMNDQARLVSEHLGSALGQADVVLGELRSMAPGLSPSSPLEDVALSLKRLITGRPGASYVSISFPDGTFEGAFVDEDGALRFQVSRVMAGFTEERVYDFGSMETLTLKEVRKSQYDPRKRAFYERAVTAPGPVWTEPYPFARTGDTGITRTVAVRTGGAQPHAVLTIDFDVRRLSPLLKRKDEQHARSERPERPILYHDDGTILADPHVRLHRGPATGQVHLLDYQSANDPVLTSFFEHGPARTKSGFSAFTTPRGEYLAATARLARESGLDWSIAFIAPEESFLASLNTYLRRSYLLSALALLVATFVSMSFARLVVKVRKEASAAREAARQARKEARELGSYRLVKRLGVGGMGEVWLAEHRLLARQAAIKLIKQDAQRDGGLAQERFRREAQSLAQLRSRNTIELFDYGVTEDGTFFYVMELLDGVDLETLVEKDGPQHPARVVQILLQSCRSLAEAHAAGMVHRDVKPANIFICRIADELDVVKVLDFGLVRTVGGDVPSEEPQLAPKSGEKIIAEATAAAQPGSSNSPSLTRADHIMGTPEFMAPEQIIAGSSVDGRADIYALGCVGYWLLTGKTVFDGPNMVAQLTAHLTEPPPALLEACPQPLPRTLADLLQTCLAKEADDRPQSAQILMNELLVIARAIGYQWDDLVGPWWVLHRAKGEAASLRPAAVEDVSMAQTMVVRRSEDGATDSGIELRGIDVKKGGHG